MEVDGNVPEESAIALKQGRAAASQSKRGARMVADVADIEMPIRLDTGSLTAHPYLQRDNRGIARPSTSRLVRSMHNPSSSNASSTITAAVAAPIPSLSEAKQCEKESEKMKTSTAGPSWFNLPAPDITP
ncbi:hypothetical protein SeLEV6574_g08406, partial [Synchytrium endobioticum]